MQNVRLRVLTLFSLLSASLVALPSSTHGSAPTIDCPPAASPSRLAGTTPVCVEEVTFRSGDLLLAGQWFAPPGDGPFPALVLIRGSGESSRGNPWTESLVAVLLDEGVGVLIPDKRGSGRSEGDWRTADFGDLADDAVSGVRYLAARSDVVPERIGVMGLSQGGQVVPVAAARSDSVAFAIDVVGAAVPFLENVRYEMVHTFREEGLSGTRLDAAETMLDTAVGYVLGAVSWEAYTEALGRTREVVGDGIADAYFIPVRDHWRWAFFRRLADFDPVEWWRRTEQPVLVLLGEADANTPTAESAARLRGVFAETGHPDATVVVFEGLGHALWQMSGPMSEHGLHPDVRRTLGEWVRRVAGGAGERP